MRNLLLLIIFCTAITSKSLAQNDPNAFRSFQFSFNRVSNAWTQYNEVLKRDFESKKLKYPPKEIFIRSFKSSNQMELWARDSDSAKFSLVKLYNVCALSGMLGPKRMEGDRQVPEGFYFIEDFNPKSDFYLSMLLNYPNYSDLMNGDKVKPGGDIYIHGGCVTVGCIPMTDQIISELYVLCLNAKLNGQNYIPVHIYPTRFDRVGLDYLNRNFKGDAEKNAFWTNLKRGYDYFEKNRKLLPVLYDSQGKYLF